MWVHRGAAGIEARAPAKLNLLFTVLGKRGDGYHEIETLMVPVSLYDSLRFAVRPPEADGPGALTVGCRWASGRMGAPLPQGRENLVFRAVELFRQRAGIEQGAAIELVKRISMQAGMGGGSSDAAAALVAANLGWKVGWNRKQLAQVAAELGSDMPFFLYGGAAICRGRGEQIERVAPLGPLNVVIVQPPVGLSTAEVYGRCRPDTARKNVGALCDALRGGLLRTAGGQMHNGLQSAAMELSPWIKRLSQEFDRVNCPAHQLTGSGSAYFGLFRTAACARRAAARLRASNMGSVMAVQGAEGMYGNAL